MDLAAGLGAGREPGGGRGRVGLPVGVILAFSLCGVVAAGVAGRKPGGIPVGDGGFQLLDYLGGQTVTADLGGDLPPGPGEDDLLASRVFAEAPALTVTVQPPVRPARLRPEVTAAVRV